MARTFYHDITQWWTHVTEQDCHLVVRTNNGWLFDCYLDPARFWHLPEVKEQYLKCLTMLRSGEEEMNDFYLEDACDWVLQPFEPLIAYLAPPTAALPVLTASGRPTLSQYLFPLQASCALTTKGDQLQSCLSQDPRQRVWRAATLILDNDFARDLDQWTRTFHPSSVELCYDDPSDVLIKTPARVIVSQPDGQLVTCFFKPFQHAFRSAQTNTELMTHRKLARAQLTSPEVRICRIYGVVRDESGLLGMLFPWIDMNAVLSRWHAQDSLSHLRHRWASQIDESIKALHQQDIIWGDAKAENILIDKDDNAWVIDFGGGYTPGWVDPDKSGTLQGDEQGLERIMEMLL